MTTAIGEGVVGPGERISTITQVNGAVTRIRQAGWPLAALWLITGGASFGLERAAEAAGVHGPAPAFGAVEGMYVLATAMVAAFGTALGLRMLVQPRRQWARLDRGLVECAGLWAVATGAFTAATEALPTGEALEQAPGLLLGLLAAMAFGLYVMVKLSLWPIGRLTGRTDVTPPRSWRLMRRATRGYVLAHLLASIPLIGVAVLVMSISGAVDGTVGTPETLVLTFALQAMSIFSLALLVAIYGLRVERPGAVADVFD